MLTLQNFSVKIADRLLLKDLSFTFIRGAIVNFYGPNGIGKSSLLKALATLAQYEGELLYNEVDIKKAKAEYRDLISYIGHNNFIDQTRTVFDNLVFWSKLFVRTESLEAAAAAFCLNKQFERKAGDLSKGWQKKLTLSTLLLKSSKVWLLDEPYSNLDDASKAILLDVIKSRVDLDAIAIMTNHSAISDPKIININLNDYVV